MSSISLELSYLFRHALVREAAYGLQLPSRRAEQHLIAFHVLEKMAKGPPPEYDFCRLTDEPVEPHFSDVFAGNISFHALSSPESCADVHEKGRLYLRRAAENARQNYQNAEAATLWMAHSKLTTGVEKSESLRRSSIGSINDNNVNLAETRCRDALEEATQSGSEQQINWVRHSLGLILTESGSLATACSLLETAYAAFRKLEMAWPMATVMSSLANLYGRTGNKDEAFVLLNEATIVLRNGKHLNALPTAIARMAVLNISIDKFELGEAQFNEVIELTYRTDNCRLRAQVLSHLCLLHRDMGQMELAKNEMNQAIELARSVGDIRTEAVTLGNNSTLLFTDGDMENAEKNLRHAIYLHRESSNVRFEALHTGGLAALLSKLGREKEAEALYIDSLELAKRINDSRAEANLLSDYAIHMLRHGQVETAKRTWQQAMHSLIDMDETGLAERSYEQMLHECADEGLERLPKPV